MKALAGSIITATLLITLGGCAWRHAPGLSMHDSSYFMEPPHIAQRGGDYFLQWRYGSLGFYFVPESRIHDGKLVFSLRGTSSSGSRSGKLGEAKIEGEKKLHALKTAGAFWWEPDGRMIQLKVVKELSDHPIHRNAASRRSINGAPLSDAAFAGSTRFRCESLT